MPRGGARPGAGRPKGSRTFKAVIDRPILNGITPLELLLTLVAMPEAPVALRFQAAKVAAPYVHRRLAPLAPPSRAEQRAMDAETAEDGTEWEGLLS